jgi:hypothetical protein
MAQTADLITVQFLAWVASRPRTAAEAREAWRSSCPRLTAWEDALDAGLIRLETAGERGAGRSIVRLTERGRAALEGERDRR